MANCGENTLVFRLHGHLFVCNQCLLQPLEQKRYFKIPNVILNEVSSSYDDMSLWLVDMALRKMKEKEESIIGIKKEVSVKMEVRPKKKKSTWVKLLNDMTLQVKAKEEKNKPTIFQLRRKIENIKFKTDLLKKEIPLLRMEIDYKKFRRNNNKSMLEEINANVGKNKECFAWDKEEMVEWCETIQETRDLKDWTQQALDNWEDNFEEDFGSVQKEEEVKAKDPACCILSC